MRRHSDAKALLTAAVLCAFALPAAAQTVKFQAQMSGSQEVPAKQSNGKGTATATLRMRYAGETLIVAPDSP